MEMIWVVSSKLITDLRIEIGKLGISNYEVIIFQTFQQVVDELSLVASGTVRSPSYILTEALIAKSDFFMGEPSPHGIILANSNAAEYFNIQFVVYNLLDELLANYPCYSSYVDIVGKTQFLVYFSASQNLLELFEEFKKVYPNNFE